MTAMTRRWLTRASFDLLFAACETCQPVVTAWVFGDDGADERHWQVPAAGAPAPGRVA